MPILSYRSSVTTLFCQGSDTPGEDPISKKAVFSEESSFHRKSVSVTNNHRKGLKQRQDRLENRLKKHSEIKRQREFWNACNEGGRRTGRKDGEHAD